MPDETRDLLIVLGKLKDRYPHWRFGQLVCNVAAWAGETMPAEVWDVSDADMLRAAQSHLAKIESQPANSQRAVI